MKHLPLDGNKLIQHLRNDTEIGVFVYDRDYQLVEWCQRMVEYTGISKEAQLKNPAYEVIKNDPYSKSSFEKALKGSSFVLPSMSLTGEVSVENKVLYDLHFFPLEEVNHQIEYVLVLATIRKSEATKKKKSFVLSTLATVDDFLKYAPIPIFIVDTDLNLKLANKSLYDFAERTPEDAKNLRSFVPAHILERLQVFIKEVIASDQAHVSVEEYNLEKGKRLLYNIIFPVRNSLGKVDAIGGYLIDLTKQVKQQRQNEQLLEEALRLNETLQEQKQELERLVSELSDRNYELDQIMYKTSHDLRAPLTSILGLLQLAKQEQDTAKLTEYHQYMENRVNKLDNFVKAMLTYAKSSRMDVVLQAIDWHQLVQESLDQVHYLEHYGKINIEISINADNYSFESDPMRINIILNNLISNAIKYADPRKDQPYVKVRINNSAKGTSIEVEDNGIGISQPYIDKVFDMFFRATDQSEGSGLGLYIVKQTVERMGGRIQIESKERQGTTIAAFLPHLSKQQRLKTMRPNSQGNKKKI